MYERSDDEFAVSLPERRYDRVAELFASALERLSDGSPPGALTREAESLGRS